MLGRPIGGQLVNHRLEEFGAKEPDELLFVFWASTTFSAVFPAGSEDWAIGSM